nr:MAG: phosphoribosylamine--glycine ligase [Thermoproteus sp. AZ2]
MRRALIIGDGAREHAIAWALAKSGARVSALASHNNPGLAETAKETGGRLYLGDPASPKDAVRAAEEDSPDLVVVGPEEPLFRGVSDALRESGFLTFGAPSRAAVIEMRKDVARALQWKHKIPGRLAYAVFNDASEALKYVKAVGAAALKPVRQAGGKGVKVVHSAGKYLEGARDALAESRVGEVFQSLSGYGDVEPAVLVEEAVWGVEYTVQAVVDGPSVFYFPAVQDNPHAYELGLGPECGGMGAVSPLDFLEPGEVEEAAEIIRRTAEAVEAELGVRYVGALSAQMMLTAYGPTIIEYYARLGDPEAVNAMFLLDGDAYELFERAASGRLAGYKAGFKRAYTAVKAIAPVGYPIDKRAAKGREISVDWGVIGREGCLVFFGSVEESGAGRYTSLGSRAFEVLGYGDSPAEAYAKAERCAAAFRGEVFYRSDIGSAEYLASMRAKAERARAVYKWRRERGLGGVKIDWAPGMPLRVFDYA